MFGKTGQTTINIILGIVIVMALSAIVFLTNTESSIEGSNNHESAQIQVFIERCIHSVGTDGIFLVSLQGGYYHTPQPYGNYSYLKIPIYWDIDKQYLPAKEILEDQVFQYLVDNLDECTDDFSVFRMQGYNITSGEVAGRFVAGRSAFFEVEYPVAIQRDDAIAYLTVFSAVVDVDLDTLHGYLGQIMNEQQNNPIAIPFGFLANLAAMNGFSFETVILDDNTVLYALVFNDTKRVEGQPLIFSFISRYGWDGPVYSGSVDIQPIPSFTINDTSILFEYHIQAQGNNLSFSDNSDFFDIDSRTGMVVFDPANLSNGERIIMIKASDDYGNSDIEFMNLHFDFTSLRPTIESIGNLTAYIGQEFAYQVEASDPTGLYLGFLDDTALFDINPVSGEIRFIPTTTGNFSIKITAVNTHGHVFEQMRLDVQ